MALQAAYRQFLAAPTNSQLADNASLNYITTLVTFNGPADIVKHLDRQSHQLKKKEEKFLDVVESQNAIAAEIETTMEFVTSGGSYLPGLDDNFLADRTVTFPIIHIVSFDSNGKILQVRQNWDQGSLLKLIDVIGKTGRNWPIRDGKDQIKLITNSVKGTGKPVEAGSSAPPVDQQEITRRSRENSTNVTRDPHASLSLFAPRDQTISESLPGVVAPRASARPAQRDFHELFANNDADSFTAAGRNGRSVSPDKAIAPKGGAGKSYQPSRIFDAQSENAALGSRAHLREESLSWKSSPKKYDHFDFADGSDPQDAPKPAVVSDIKSKHASNWDFEHFQTPQKVVPGKTQGVGNVRQWGNEDDEVVDSPIRPKAAPKPRKDADSHFQFNDEATPENRRAVIGRPRGQGMDNGMGLYRGHNVYEEGEDEPTQQAGPALKNITNVKDRSKDFNPHFAITDDSPAGEKKQARVPEDQAKAIKMMNANWDTYDSSPSANQKENIPETFSPSSRPIHPKGPLAERTADQPKGITIAGDGMGSRKGEETGVQKAKGIRIGGDGMGGKGGVGRSWGFGDDSDGEEAGGLNAPGGTFRKGNPGKAHSNQPQGGDFWNY